MEQQSSKIAKQLVKAILTLYLSLALIMTALQILSEYVLEKDRLAGRIADMSDTFAPSLAQGLWTFDDQQINASLVGAFNIAEIHGVKVVAANGSNWAIGNYTNDSGKLVFNGPEQVDNSKDLTQDTISTTLFSDTFDIERQGEVLGTQTIYYSINTVVNNLWAPTLITVFLAILKTLLLWWISVSVINRLVAKPLGRLDTAVSDYDLANTEPAQFDALESHKPTNELNHLSDSITEMTNKLANQNKRVADTTLLLKEQIDEQTKDLSDKNHLLEDALKTKAKFLAVMSHELRTPLNGIHGSLQILKSRSNGGDELLDTMIQSSNQLNDLITDVLGFSETETNKLVLRKEPLKLVDLYNGACAQYQSICEKKAIGFKSSFDDRLTDRMVIADRKRLEQLVFKLLDNAVKFTYKGHVYFAINALDSEDTDKQVIEIIVKDTGVGIIESKQDLVFDLFTQLDNRVSREFGGIGIGLAICKQTVDLMNGSIKVDSHSGEGSTFTVQLPLAVQVGQRSEPPNQIQLNNSLSVLVVDDVDTNVMMVKFMLEDLGFNVIAAKNGIKAIEQFQAHRGELLCIFMDYHMPEMNGIEATIEIRKEDSEIPIYALTASDLHDTKAQCDAAGMNGFIAKPVNEIDIRNALTDATLRTAK